MYFKYKISIRMVVTNIRKSIFGYLTEQSVSSYEDLVNSDSYRAELHGFHLVKPSP